MVGHLVRIFPWTPPLRGVSGMSNWEKTKADLGHAGEIITLGWPGSPSVFSQRSWWRWLGGRKMWASLLRLLGP